MKRDASAPCQTMMNTGMAWSVINEISTLLDRLASQGETSSIDLRSLPLTDADRAQLEELLGRGEVRASLDLMGGSEVWETSLAGVWWVRHEGAGGQVSSEEIAITQIPEILRAHPADIEASAAQLRRDLQEVPRAPHPDSQEGQHV